MASLSHYNGRGRAKKVNANQLKPVRDYSFPHTRFLSLLRHIGFPLRFRTGARAPKFFVKPLWPRIFGMGVFLSGKKKTRLAFYVTGGFYRMCVLE